MNMALSVIVIIGLVFIAAAPGEIAERREHKNKRAIRVCGIIGVFVWPAWIVAIVWSLTNPD